MASGNEEANYFKEIIPDPVTVVFFEDKVVIIRATGEVIEKELYVSQGGMSSADEAKIRAGGQYWASLGPGNVVEEEGIAMPGENDPRVPNLGGYQPGPLAKDLQPVRRPDERHTQS